MHVDPYIVLGSAVVGLLVGLTGAGGGALMTPMLILLFGIKPSTAISSDLVAAVVMRPFGAAVHIRKGTASDEPICFLFVSSQSDVPLMTHPRNLIVVMLGSANRFSEGGQLLARGWQLYDQWAAGGRMVDPNKTL